MWSPSSLLLNGQLRQSGRSVKLIIHLNPVVMCRIIRAATYYKSLKNPHDIHRDKFRFALISNATLVTTDFHKMQFTLSSYAEAVTS
jgi:hypothetical protein